MMVWLDARLPIRFGLLESRGAEEAVVTDGASAPPPAARFTVAPSAHGSDCACCLPRSGAATALADLFRSRAVSRERPFSGVLAVVGPAGEAAIRAALAADPLVSARYRLAGPGVNSVRP